MPKYRYIHREFHRVVTEQYEEFDTNDQKHWDELLGRLEDHDEDEFPLPLDAPNDPAVWKNVLEKISPDDLQNIGEEYWESSINGDYEIENILIDENGIEI